MKVLQGSSNTGSYSIEVGLGFAWETHPGGLVKGEMKNSLSGDVKAHCQDKVSAIQSGIR